MGWTPLDSILLCSTLGVALYTAPVSCRASASQNPGGVYGNTAFLRCQDGSIDQADTASSTTLLNYQWIIPSGQIVRVENPMTNSSKHELLRGGFILQIQTVDDGDFGLYTCLVFSNKDIIQVTRHSFHRVNWAGEATEYTSKIQYGFLAGFVVLVVMAMLCYNYDQHQERHDVSYETKRSVISNGQELSSIVVTQAEPGHSNQGFQRETTMEDVRL